MNKLNGWNRVSIILTVMYLIAAAGYSYSSYSREMTFNFKTVSEIRDFATYVKPGEAELQRIMPLRKDTYIDCITEIDQSLDPDAKAEEQRFCVLLRDIPLNSYIKKPSYVSFGVILIAFPAMFWCLWLLMIFIVKWVLSGFKLNS